MVAAEKILESAHGIAVLSIYNIVYPLAIWDSYWIWPFIVNFPIENGDFHSDVKLQEGNVHCPMSQRIYRWSLETLAVTAGKMSLKCISKGTIYRWKILRNKITQIINTNPKVESYKPPHPCMGKFHIAMESYTEIYWVDSFTHLLAIFSPGPSHDDPSDHPSWAPRDGLGHVSAQDLNEIRQNAWDRPERSMRMTQLLSHGCSKK